MINLNNNCIVVVSILPPQFKELEGTTNFIKRNVIPSCFIYDFGLIYQITHEEYVDLIRTIDFVNKTNSTSINKYIDFIDCVDNYELFKALCAYDEKIVDKQYFVENTQTEILFQEPEIPTNTLCKRLYYDNDNYRRATRKEIVKFWFNRPISRE